MYADDGNYLESCYSNVMKNKYEISKGAITVNAGIAPFYYLEIDSGYLDVQRFRCSNI